MIERHVTFHVHDSKGPDFIRFFYGEYRPAMAKTTGFVRAELLRDLDRPQDFKMLLRFDTVEAAAAWRASADHAALKPAIKSMYEGSELVVYEVITEEVSDGQLV